MIITGPDGKEYRKITPGGNEEIINEIEEEDNEGIDSEEHEIDGVKVKITRIEGEKAAEKLKNILEEMLDISSDSDDEELDYEVPEIVHVNVGHVTKPSFVRSCNMQTETSTDSIIVCIDKKFDEESFIDGMDVIEKICLTDGIYKTSKYTTIREFIAGQYKDTKRPLEINYAKGKYITFRKVKLDRYMFLSISHDKANEKNKEEFKALRKIYKDMYEQMKDRNLYTVRAVNHEFSDLDFNEAVVSLTPSVLKVLDEFFGGAGSGTYAGAIANLFGQFAINNVVRDNSIELSRLKKILDVKGIVVNTFVDNAYMQTATIQLEDLYSNLKKIHSFIDAKSEEDTDSKE